MTIPGALAKAKLPPPQKSKTSKKEHFNMFNVYSKECIYKHDVAILNNTRTI